MQTVELAKRLLRHIFGFWGGTENSVSDGGHAQILRLKQPLKGSLAIARTHQLTRN
jgi:hypothetical protein